MSVTFTGQNERRLTKQKSISFLLENCSVNNLTGSLEFGFKDSSQEIKFDFDQGNIFDFDDMNCFSYVDGETFSISGDISPDDYTYKVNDKIVVQGKTKNNFEIEKFFVNTTNCTLTADNLKIYSDGVSNSITAPTDVGVGASFDVQVSNTSSDGTLYIYAVSFEGDSGTSFSLNTFDAEITNGNSGNINLTNTTTIQTSKTLKLKLDTNIGEIKKQFPINLYNPSVTETANSLTLINQLPGITESTTEYIYLFTSSVHETDYLNPSNSGYLTQQSDVSLEYVSGTVGDFYEVTNVIIIDGGQNYTDPEVAFGAATSPDVTATGTVSQTSGVIDSVTITEAGTYFGAVPTTTFSDQSQNGSGAEGIAMTDSYTKTFTSSFDMGTGSVRNNVVVDFLQQGLTEAQGDAYYDPTFGDGKYKTSSPISIPYGSNVYIRIVYSDKADKHPMSVKLKVESLYGDTANSRTVEEATINIT